jgi:small subunit ribosomal protein S1
MKGTIAVNAIFKPLRTISPEQGRVFFAMPYGKKIVADGGEPFDFDAFYRNVCVPTVADDCGMVPLRVDGIYGPQGVLDAVWRTMQQAELVVVDFSAQSLNVAFELGWAMLLGKRIVLLTQRPEDIPSDVRGLYRYIIYSANYADIMRLRTELTLQLKALSQEPAEEMAPMPMPGGGRNSVPARIISIDREYVVVQDESGRRGVMGVGDVDYTRMITDMSRRFKVGDRLDGAFVVDPMRSEMRYTLVGGETNPWPTLASRYPVGTTLCTAVHNVVDGVGAFARIEFDVNGMIPMEQFQGAPPAPGTEIEVTVTRMDAEQRRIALRLNRILGRPAVQATTSMLVSPGWQGTGRVVKIVPEADGRGGYILVRLADGTRPAMLLARDMTNDLRLDLNNGHVDVGEELDVEVLSVDPTRNRVLLRSLPDIDAGAAEAAAAA